MIVKSKNNKTDDESAADRRKRRADRNRMRTIKHAHKLLDQIHEGVANGFSHLGWSNAANALKQVSAFLTPEEHSNIGIAWRHTYAYNTPSTQLEDIIHTIKKRIEGENENTVAERDPWERQSHKKHY